MCSPPNTNAQLKWRACSKWHNFKHWKIMMMRMIPSTNIGSRVLLWDPSASALPPLGGWAVASTTARAQLPILVSWCCPSGPILRGAGNGEELAEVRPEREQSLQGRLHCWCTMCSFGNTRTQVLLCIKAGWVVPPLLVIMSRAGRADTRLYGWVQVRQCQLALGATAFLISTFCHWCRRFQL